MQKCISSGHGSIKLILGLLAYKLGPLEVQGLANCLNKSTKEISNNEKHTHTHKEVYLMWSHWEIEQRGPVTTHIILGVLIKV